MSRTSLSGGDRLARGARSAAFAVGQGTAKGKAELKNVAKEGRDTTFDYLKPVKNKKADQQNVEPLFNRVLVRKDDEIAVSEGGILLPDKEKDSPNQGTVISVGKGKLNAQGNLQPMTLKAGDKVLFGKYVGTLVKVNGEEVLMMDEEQILARIR